MKFAEINKRFTELVAEYISNGWTINTGTMRGSQGELGKVDMTNGVQLIRILMERFHERANREERHEYGYCSFEGVRIVVGFDTNGAKVNQVRDGRTVWNNNLDVIREEKFYEIGDSDNEWFGTEEEAKAARKLSRQRYFNRQMKTVDDITDRAWEIALRWVRQQPRCKTYGKKDITVYREYNYNIDGLNFLGTSYRIEARDRSFRL